MPLSGAEKTRRYRERLKAERPEEYKAQCKRNLERMKTKKKKISEMSEEEANEQRKKWRNEKNANNKKKKAKNMEHDRQTKESDISVDKKKFQSILSKCRLLVKKTKNMTKYVQKLKTQKETYKKRYQRIKAKTTSKINDLELTINKMKAREEVLELTLKTTYKNTKARDEKRIFRKIIHNAKNKKYVCKMMGLKGKGRKLKKNVKREEIPEITKFYLRDDVSRNTAGRKETRTKKKNKMQIRYLCDSIMELYKKYRSEGGKYGFSTFYKYKPFYVLSPHINARETCQCIKHSNFEFLMTALNKSGALKIRLKELLSQIACDTKNYTCMYNKCEVCKDRKPIYECTDVENVTWFRWERLDHTYTKKDETGSKEIKTKKTAKVLKTGNLDNLKSAFEKDLVLFKKHFFNVQQQIKQFQTALSQIKDNEVVIVCDFSENYETKLANEIQSMHYGASKSQVTLHTGMVYWRNECQSFCTVSNVNDHQPPAIWAHLWPIMKLIKEKTPHVSVVHIFSDGPSSQYRQKNNFFLLVHFTKELKFSYATWSFFESGHGKNVADGIGGCVKRALDRKVSHGMDAANAIDAYNILVKCLKSIKVFLIEESSIHTVQKILPTNIQPLKGTLQVHQVITNENNSIKYRDVSCFCGLLLGKCNCFLPQIHFVVPSNSSSNFRPIESKENLISTNAIKDAVPISIEPKLAASSENSYLLTSNDIEIEFVSEELNQSADFDELAKITDGIADERSSDLIDISLKAKKYDVTVEEGQPEVTSMHSCTEPTITELDEVELSEQIVKYFGNGNEENYNTDLKIHVMSETQQPDPPSSSQVCCNTPCYSNPERKSISQIPTIKKENQRNAVAIASTSKTQVPCKRDVSKPILKRKSVTQTTATNKLRLLECQSCTCSILGQKAKCIACKKWFCDDCVDGPIFIDFICEKCLSE